MRLSFLDHRGRTALLVALSLAGIVVTLRAERASEARANRLHRDGVLEEAATIYGDRVEADPGAVRLRYNLGTTLLRMGSSAAYDQLAAGSAADDRKLRTWARYNMGLWSLIQALVASSTDSVLAHAARAIEANKDALRLDPGHLDAQWNLSLAQRILVSATPEEGMGNIDPPSGDADVGERQLVNEPQPFQQEEAIGEVPSEGEEESRADEDLDPLSLSQAGEILGTGHLDPSTIAGKLLLREGRSLRRRGITGAGPPW